MHEADQTWKKKKAQNRRQCPRNSLTRRPGTKYFPFPALPDTHFFFLFPSSFGPGSVTRPSTPPYHPPTTPLLLPSPLHPPHRTSPRKFSSSFTTGPRSLEPALTSPSPAVVRGGTGSRLASEEERVTRSPTLDAKNWKKKMQNTIVVFPWAHDPLE